MIQARRSTMASVRLYQSKRNASLRNIKWELSDEFAIRAFSKQCFYCGVDWQANNSLNGLDRVDNGKHYFESNVVSSCFQCQRSKSDLPVEEFIAWVLRASDCIKNNKLGDTYGK